MDSKNRRLKEDIEAIILLSNRLSTNPQVIMTCGGSVLKPEFVDYSANKLKEFKELNKYQQKHKARTLDFLNKNKNER